MATANPRLDEFAGGQMTDLPAWPGGSDPTALFEIVTPGNSANGVNYAINSLQLAAFLAGAGYSNPTMIVSGATYPSVGTDTRILVNKAVGSATSIVLLSSSAYSQPLLVKDLKGDSAANPITVTFSGGQLIDGQSSIVIDNPYGFYWFNPVGGGWYATS